MSAPHIYHSALFLSPSTSIIRKLYKHHARPLARIVRGLSLSWELAVATVYLGPPIPGLRQPPRVVWSPCSKFIAASTRESVEVLDAVTLNRLATFKHPPNYDYFSFSPDSRSLALFTSSELISWDIQTGGRLSEILPKPGERSPDVTSFTYSKDGKMVAVACAIRWHTSLSVEYNIHTFDLPSRTRLGPLPVSDGQLVPPIWTHDEYLRFAIIHPGSMTIWEVEFTLNRPPTLVESFPIPDEVIGGDEFLFLPVLYRLAFTLRDTIHIRDVKASKPLLKSEQVFDSHPQYSFSSDGRFFVFAIPGRRFRIWTESPAGYALHQQPPFLLDNLERPFLSPNGRSIIFPLDATINLWHTDDRTLSPPSPPTEERNQQYFLLAFSPNEESAAFAQLDGDVVTIIDLRSGDLRLTIDTGMEVQCLGVAGDTVVVVDEGKIVTWNLPGGDRAFNASINDSIRTTVLDGYSLNTLSLSPDLSRIVALVSFSGPGIYDVPTGKCLAITMASPDSQLRFTLDGLEVWTTYDYLGIDFQYSGWEIIEGGISSATELKPLEETLYTSRTFLWDSICGYQVTDDGWVLSPTRKRLLWLPHRWRSDQEYRLWSGRFLGLTHRLLSEVVILEFSE